MSNGERRKYSGAEKVKILRFHLLEYEPIEKVGKVAPGPEGGRVVSSPFAADERLLDRDAEENQI